MAAVISNYKESGLKEHFYSQPVCLQRPGLTDSHPGQPHPPRRLQQPRTATEGGGLCSIQGDPGVPGIALLSPTENLLHKPTPSKIGDVAELLNTQKYAHRMGRMRGQRNMFQTKEQDNPREKELNRIVIHNLQKDLLEKEMSTYSSILAWEIPWTEKLSGLWSVGLPSQAQSSDLACM